MQEKGISKKELIRRTGLSESTITRIMRRDMVGNLWTWNAVCDAIGITMNDILEARDGR